MTPRERAKLRLSRHVPETKRCDARQPASRLVARLVEAPVPGPQRLEVRVREGAKLRELHGADVNENAPQLIRLVRFPFALSPVQPGRTDGSERPAIGRARRDPTPLPGREMDQLRAEYTLASPTAAHPHRPEVRPHPFARARQAARDDSEGLP